MNHDWPTRKLLVISSSGDECCLGLRLMVGLVPLLHPEAQTIAEIFGEPSRRF